MLMKMLWLVEGYTCGEYKREDRQNAVFHVGLASYSVLHCQCMNISQPKSANFSAPPPHLSLMHQQYFPLSQNQMNVICCR